MKKLFDYNSGLTPKDEMVNELLNFINKRIDLCKNSIDEKLKERDYQHLSIVNSSLETYEFIKWYIEKGYYLN
jgi:hypothetical protein